MGGPGFTWDYCWATRMAELVLGESSGRLLVRSVSVSGRCYGIPAAEVCCHNTHAKKPDRHSHADIFPLVLWAGPLKADAGTGCWWCRIGRFTALRGSHVSSCLFELVS